MVFLLPEGLLVGIKDTQDDNGAVAFNNKMDSKGEGIDGFYANTVIAYGGGGRQPADIVKENIQGIINSKPSAADTLL